MQIVRDLAGYTWGRSDLVRRAMSKKKRQSWRRNARTSSTAMHEEGVKGCIANGIDEKTANQIYDEMIGLREIRLQQVPCGSLCGGLLSDGIFEISTIRRNLWRRS